MRSIYLFILLLTAAHVSTAQLKTDTTVAPKSMMLRPVIVTRHRSTIKQDSLEVRTIYKKQFRAAEHKIALTHIDSNSPHLTVNGVFSELAYLVSGKKKKGKEFKKQFLTDVEERRIKLRVTPAMVATATGLKDADEINSFTASCHMPYALATYGTDLELMQWLRNEYNRRYLAHLQDSLIGNATGKR